MSIYGIFKFASTTFISTLFLTTPLFDLFSNINLPYFDYFKL